MENREKKRDRDWVLKSKVVFSCFTLIGLFVKLSLLH